MINKGICHFHPRPIGAASALPTGTRLSPPFPARGALSATLCLTGGMEETIVPFSLLVGGLAPKLLPFILSLLVWPEDRTGTLPLLAIRAVLARRGDSYISLDVSSIPSSSSSVLDSGLESNLPP